MTADARDEGPVPTSRRLSILLLADNDKSHAGNVLDHIESFGRYSRHDVFVFNPRLPGGAGLLELDEFDVIVIHYSLVVTMDEYLPAALAEAIARFEGLKIQFIQDEYRWIDAITTRVRELGIHLLFTLAPPQEVARLYGPLLKDTMVVTTLAGFVPNGLVGRSVSAVRDRALDVGYRGRAVPYWLGRLGHEKVAIAQAFLAHPATADLRCDISWTESDRLYGESWISFIASCRATLGTESGASIGDFDGVVEACVRRYVSEHPAATFEEVASAVLAPYEGNLVINVISPRIFEAAALRTALVLFPGEYSGIVRPWEHYIPLEKDLSNIEDVLRCLRDDDVLDALTERAYADLVASGRYSLRAFVQGFDELVERYGAAVAPAAKVGFEAAVQAQRRRWRSADARRVARAGAERVTTWRLLRRHPAVRALRASAIASGSGNGDRLDEDILRLALLADAHSGALATTTPFEIEPLFDEPSGRLTLVSHALEEERPDGGIDLDAKRQVARDALEQGGVREIVWYHANLGLAVPVTMTGAVVASYPVGYYRVYGAHKFSALERLLATGGPTEREAWAAVLTKPSARALARLKRRRLTGDHVVGLLGRRPIHYAGRTAETLRYSGATPLRRTFVLTFLSERKIRARVGLLDLLDDLAKLQRLPLGEEGTIRLDVDDRTRTSGLRQVDVMWERPGEADHSFLALSAYASLHLEEAIALLEEAIDGHPTRIATERNGRVG